MMEVRRPPFLARLFCGGRRASTRSEIVIPLIKNNTVLGVLDLDSPKLARFTAADQTGLESIAAILIEACEW